MFWRQSVFREAIDSALHTPNCIGQQEPRKMIWNQLANIKMNFCCKNSVFDYFCFCFWKGKLRKVMQANKQENKKRFRYYDPNSGLLGESRKSSPPSSWQKKKLFSVFWISDENWHHKFNLFNFPTWINTNVNSQWICQERKTIFVDFESMFSFLFSLHQPTIKIEKKIKNTVSTWKQKIQLGFVTQVQMLFPIHLDHHKQHLI